MHLSASSFNCATSFRRTLVLSLSMGKSFSSMSILLAATPSSIHGGRPDRYSCQRGTGIYV